ncbi:hypothetical protein A8O14_07930 [Polynucleobacter wuianus]|uniref:Uncharacterized protein n=1 Tax=Polynucleobacter wuianus TaxID=1743168 RepID=A0A191UGG8_9BURK|nr:hypothetical protein A8O14_07930 [Polynucleobacter wuianus]
MLTSALVLITMLPLQVSPSGKDAIPFNRPLAVAVFVDSAKILGLPKFKLRDSNGNRYRPEKNLIQEPLAVLQQNAGLINASNENLRKSYIQSYVRR